MLKFTEAFPEHNDTSCLSGNKSMSIFIVCQYVLPTFNLQLSTSNQNTQKKTLQMPCHSRHEHHIYQQLCV